MGDIKFDPQVINPDGAKKPSQLGHFAELSSGAGASIFKVDNNGFFVGGSDYASAPFKVNYNGTVRVSVIKDLTYGLNGVFCFTYNTNTTTDIIIDTGLPANGGLLNATLNYTDANSHYNWLPGFNTGNYKSYFYIFKDAGHYKIYVYAANIYADVAHTRLYFTLLFNSLESNGW